MTIKQAKLLRKGSAFWVPSRIEKSGFKLHVVIAHTDVVVVTVDEHEYRSAWLFSERNSWAGVTLVRPVGASEAEVLVEHLRKIGMLHK